MPKVKIIYPYPWSLYDTCLGVLANHPHFINMMVLPREVVLDLVSKIRDKNIRFKIPPGEPILREYNETSREIYGCEVSELYKNADFMRDYINWSRDYNDPHRHKFTKPHKRLLSAMTFQCFTRYVSKVVIRDDLSLKPLVLYDPTVRNISSRLEDNLQEHVLGTRYEENEWEVEKCVVEVNRDSVVLEFNIHLIHPW
jgi:hypothetical protein